MIYTYTIQLCYILLLYFSLSAFILIDDVVYCTKTGFVSIIVVCLHLDHPYLDYLICFPKCYLIIKYH